MSISSLPSRGVSVSGTDGGEEGRGGWGRTDCLATEVVCCEPEPELADDAADVGSCFHEAFEPCREGVTAVQTILQHRRDGLYAHF